MTTASDQTQAARSRIQEAAHRLFAERGPDEVTMAEVARAAGVARATVFNHFGSKRALIESMTEGVLDLYFELLQGALADEDRPTSSLIRHLFVVMGFGIESERQFHRAVFRQITRLSLGIDEGGATNAARQRNQDAVVKLIVRGQERGDITKAHAAETLAGAFASLVTGTVTHWLYDDDTQPLRERMRDAADVFLAPVAVESGAPPPFEAVRGD